MRIAIPTEDFSGLDDNVEEEEKDIHFFTIVEVEAGEIVGYDLLECPFRVGKEMANWLRAQDVDTLIVFSLNEKIVPYFERQGIYIVYGASGRVRDVVKNFIMGETFY